MHELSIAINIIENIEDETKKINATSISDLTIEIGRLSGVVMEALEFAMQEAVKGTILQDARIAYNTIDAKAKCNSCGEEYLTEDFFSVCPKCNNPYSDITEGKELRITKIKIISNE